MEMSLTCLKLAGMFPRVIERDWKIIDGRTCSRAGKVSFACLVFSVLFAFIRFAFFVHVLFVEVPDMYGGETMFDRLGSRIWDCSYFVWELVTVISVFFKHKAIKSCCNKVFILMHLYGISPKEVKAPISQKSLLNPIVGIFFYIIGYIFSSHAFSYVQSTLLVIQVLSSLIFVSFCRTLNQYLALLQCKVHSIDQAVLSKLQARPLYHSKHFLNILMRKDSIKCLYFQPSLGRTTNLIKENRNPELLIHLRLQEVIDILSREFMDSVGPGILIQLTNSIVTLTLGSYFMIKAASTHTLNTNGSGYFALYALYIALAFITMAGPQSIEKKKVYQRFLITLLSDEQHVNNAATQKLLHSLQQPVELSLASFATLDRSLLTSMVGCIVSYLVIALQMGGVDNGESRTSTNSTQLS